MRKDGLGQSRQNQRFRSASRAFALTLLVFCIAGAAGGCVSTGKPRGGEYPVELIAGGRAVFSGRAVPLAELPASLRSAGVPGDAVVKVTVASGTTQKEMATVTGNLASRGYRRVVFVTLRKATVQVGKP